MKQSFLDSLIGMRVSDAVPIVANVGLDPRVVPDGMAVASLALPKTVFLGYSPENVVLSAWAGDPLEVEKE